MDKGTFQKRFEKNEKKVSKEVSETNDFYEMFKAFSERYPLDMVFDRMSSNRAPLPRLEIYKYRELRRIADALELIAGKKK